MYAIAIGAAASGFDPSARAVLREDRELRRRRRVADDDAVQRAARRRGDERDAVRARRGERRRRRPQRRAAVRREHRHAAAARRVDVAVVRVVRDAVHARDRARRERRAGAPFSSNASTAPGPASATKIVRSSGSYASATGFASPANAPAGSATTVPCGSNRATAGAPPFAYATYTALVTSTIGGRRREAAGGVARRRDERRGIRRRVRRDRLHGEAVRRAGNRRDGQDAGRTRRWARARSSPARRAAR